MNDAKEEQKGPELQRALEALVNGEVVKVVNNTEVTRDGDEFGELAVTEH
jgi:hypothetical protein